MPTFKEIQAQLAQAKSASSKKQRELFLVQEQLKRLGKDKDRAIRGQRPGGLSLDAIQAEEARLQTEVQSETLAAGRLQQVASDFALQFLPFSDPRTNVDQWDDDTPALLMPMRMETRFKRLGSGAAIQHQLWVRVFPDECSIDTFEDIPSETEIKRAQDYWLELWAAGKSEEEGLVDLIEKRKKGAWKSLSSSLQAGRAYWLIGKYRPENEIALPDRLDKTDVLLAIPTTNIPTQAADLASYWATIWAAGNDQAAQATAFDTLSNTIGDLDTTTALIENYRPFNLDETRPTVIVRFLTQGSADSQRTPSTEEVFLDILLAPDQDIPPQQTALANYWSAFWLADGDPLTESNVFQQLVAAVGDSTLATDLIADFIPNNLDECRPPQVSVHFIDFPTDPERKNTAWGQAAKIKTMPERLVVLGYQGKDDNGDPVEVLNEIGNYIPDPLIVGPNPSIDASEVLAQALTLNFNELTTEQERTEQLRLFYDQSNASIQRQQTEGEFVDSFDGLVGEQLEDALTLLFDNLRDDVKAGMYVDYLCQRSETKWLFDFERAIEVGMGFKINISRDQYLAGFDRLFVVGVKLSADDKEGQVCLEQLLSHHHYGASGLSILPQGFATNNTETENAGYAEDENNDQTYDRYLTANTNEDPREDRIKRDGRWLCEWLGIDPERSSLNKAENYHFTDQLESRAMNTALYNATFGYFFDSMMTPVLDDDRKSLVRDFSLNYVSGRGALPAIRIGDQPYGILPVSRNIRDNWLFQPEQNLLFSSSYGNQIENIQRFYRILGRIRADFERLLDRVPFIGKAGDPHQILLDVLGLHATSVEYYQRYAQSFQHLYNYLVSLGTFNQSAVLSGLQAFLRRLFNPQAAATEQLQLTNNAAFNEWLETEYRQAGLQLLAELGYRHNRKGNIPILEKFFFTKGNLLKGHVVDDLPLSESRIIRPYLEPLAEGDSGLNYIQWLAEKAANDFDAVKRQTGFIDNKRPTALLYQMLRHSLLLGYSETSFKLYRRADVLSPSQVNRARVEPDFIGIQTNLNQPKRTRWNFLDDRVNLLTEGNLTVAEQISDSLSRDLGLFETQQLRQEIAALGQLAEVPTARLERLFAEHIDCCSYRLDAWLQGFNRLQLQQMRTNHLSEAGHSLKTGIYLGTYSWVEDLRPDNETLRTANLSVELAAIFDPDNQNDIVEDSSNGGYIHAPSINQALTAAVLRNAYITNADEDHASIYKVNLSSERVRMAIGIIEGMQQGQSLGALLGYQLERGLHDRTNEELDVYIYELRKLFPLTGNRNRETDVADDNEALQGDKAVSKLEARNVVDGRRLVEHVERTQKFSYPFGIETGDGPKQLKPVKNEDQRTAINQEVKRLRNINDALSDLAIAEGIHQVVQANFDRAGNALDTFSKGAFPQTPEVVRTPRSGISLTHRFGIHLKTSGLAMPAVPRAVADPYIAELIESSLPAMVDIACQVEIVIPAYENGVNSTTLSRTVTIAELGLEAIDLFYLLDIKSNKQLTALDEYIINRVRQAESPRPDATINIHYTQTVTGKYTLLEIASLLESLRSVVLSARPLKPTDIQLPNETQTAEDNVLSMDSTRITDALSTFAVVHNAFTTNLYDKFVDPTDFGQHFEKDRFAESAVMDDTFLGNFDQVLGSYLAQLEAFKTFSIPESGFAYVYDRKSAIYQSLYTVAQTHINRWNDKLAQYDQLILDSAVIALIPEDNLTDEQRIGLLRQAERCISTVYTTVLSDLPGAGTEVENYRNFLQDTRRPAFINKKTTIENWIAADHPGFQALIATLNALKFGADPIDQYDLTALDTQAEERQIIVLAEDIVSHTLKLAPVFEKIEVEVAQRLKTHDAVIESFKRIKLLTEASHFLFGEDFQLVPTFNLGEAHRNELQQSHGDTNQLLAYQTNTLGTDFPVDEWLYGVARVRERLGQWENLTVLAESINDRALDLVPLQLPYQPGDTWLALEYGPDYEIGNDKLLYTAYYRDLDFNAPQAGLLIDEWTEIIPTKTETTGLTFQYDQPATEPAQAMLLVTPAQMAGQWEWEDLPGALHEALDLAKLRALEPEQIAQTPYAQFLPATVSSVTRYPLVTMALNYSLNNELAFSENEN